MNSHSVINKDLMSDDLFSSAEKRQSNTPEMSVSDLAFSLKRTLEDAYGRVRVRGELSRVSIPASGHMYSDLKDDKTIINVICWRGQLGKLSVKPEEGLDVVVTGRITTYPARSNYQLIIESMELAGEGALLKMLEERKKKLAAEGLFAPERKKAIPFLPKTIGVVTSETGAVIRDIIHRIEDRFPSHVLLWPAPVQGEGSAEKIAAAIRGMDALDAKPDVLIVARGGGSLEDLMPFNEEVVVRAVAECSIPVISAVGHETDTTLVDYAADRRAPTPTGAAEIAVPERVKLMAQAGDISERLNTTIFRRFSDMRNVLATATAKLGDPARLMEVQTQRIDHIGEKLNAVLMNFVNAKKSLLNENALRIRKPSDILKEKEKSLEYSYTRLNQQGLYCTDRKRASLNQAAASLKSPRLLLRDAAEKVNNTSERLSGAAKRDLERKETQWSGSVRLLETLSFKSTLKRGFVVVRDKDNKAVTDPSGIRKDQALTLEYADDKHIGVVVNES
ncbi:MAG: exodeoxyribonuclease VII large subunit [Micavibrio sp.]|nr:exodeoxyribonuclease VII large subunit [Micavibrio sp.]